MVADLVAPRTPAGGFIDRLALGTAQFGLDYGINNTTGRPTDATVEDILHTARAAGLTLLDTAAAYGDSESRLGNWLSLPGNDASAFGLVTKLAAGPAAQVRKELRESLVRLRQANLHGCGSLLLGGRHKPEDPMSDVAACLEIIKKVNVG